MQNTIIGLSYLIGHTPLVELTRLGPEGGPRVFVKLELNNPAGSAKDRPADRMLNEAFDAGLLRPGGTVVESSSGNFGVALAQQAAYRGLRFVCVVDPRSSEVNRRLIQAYGGVLHMVTQPDPIHGDWLRARINAVEQLVAATPGAWWPNQYANVDNAAAHRDTTMPEVLESLGFAPTSLYVATSSTGTLVGCQECLQQGGHGTHVIAVDAKGSVLFGGEPAERCLPGMGAGVIPPMSKLAHPNRVARVDDLDCVVGCRVLVQTEALLVGASAGGVVSAYLRDQGRYTEEDTVVLIAHDGGARYLDTVYDDNWVDTELGCPAVELQQRVAKAVHTIGAPNLMFGGES